MLLCRLLVLLSVINEVNAVIQLLGAGATFPAHVYITWMAAYRSMRRPFVDLRLSYKALGSGFGKRAIAARSVHYAGSDSLLSDAEYLQNPDLQMLPTLAGLASRYRPTAHTTYRNDTYIYSSPPCHGFLRW